jgi:hypothetical protein
MKLRRLCISTLAALAALHGPLAHAATPGSIDFSNGLQGWYGDEGGTNLYNGIDSSTGDGSLGYHTTGYGFGYALKNNTYGGLLGDYTGMKGFTFSVDVTTAQISDGGKDIFPVAREFVLELRDYDKRGGALPYSSVWVMLGIIGDGRPGTQHFSATIADTSSNTLPAGWFGAGGVDGSYHSVLPHGQTLNRLLRDVDEVVLSTFVPGYLTGVEAYFDITVDNIAISAVPEPSQWGMMAAGLGLLGLTARRRKEQRLG